MVRLLEEERSDKKQMELVIHGRDQAIEDLKSKLNHYTGQYDKMRQDIREIHLDKQKQIDENEMLKMRLLDMDKKVRIADAA